MTAPSETVPLPEGWPKLVRSAILHVIGLAHMALAYSRSWAADSSLGQVCLQAALDVAKSEIALLTEELRIKDSRLGRVPPPRATALLAPRAGGHEIRERKSRMSPFPIAYRAETD